MRELCPSIMRLWKRQDGFFNSLPKGASGVVGRFVQGRKAGRKRFVGNVGREPRWKRPAMFAMFAMFARLVARWIAKFARPRSAARSAARSAPARCCRAVAAHMGLSCRITGPSGDMNRNSLYLPDMRACSSIRPVRSGWHNTSSQRCSSSSFFQECVRGMY